MNSGDKQNNTSAMLDEDPNCPLLRAQLAELQAELAALMAAKEIKDAQIAAVQASLVTHGCNQSGGGAG